MALALAVAGQDAEKPAATPAKEKRVCHTVKMTGTRVSQRRICQTQSEYSRQNSRVVDSLDYQREADANDRAARMRP